MDQTVRKFEETSNKQDAAYINQTKGNGNHECGTIHT